jgi:hypothetical protein
MHSLLTQQETPVSVLPEERWHELQKLIRQIHRCRVHGFQRARKLLEGAFKAELAALATVLDSQLAQLRRPSPKCATVRDIYEDLRALNDEFEDVLVDLEAGTISATTDPITLRGTELGPFEIRLEWRELAERSPYRVIALAPNPAATNDAVTHPHVQDERLCEGEGRAAIEAALDQGRLGDFFLIVTRLLRTYAQGQAYVELSGWEGLVCSDCGARIDADERYLCERCEAELCGECSSTCECCGMGFCSECVKSCNACGQASCESCLTSCTHCDKKCCQECLNDQLCSTCQAEQEEETDDEKEDHEEENDESTSGSLAGAGLAASADGSGACAEVQPDGLGEAALPA